MNRLIKTTLLKRTLLALIASLGLFAGTPANAALLGLTGGDTPDISSLVNVNYDANTDIFTLIGLSYDLFISPGVDEEITNGVYTPTEGSFDLTAEIDEFGMLSSGSLVIAGITDSYNNPLTPLLTGDITAVGSLSSSDPLEFLFDVTGGDAAALFGSTGGIILSMSNFIGWNNDFSATMAAADTLAVPEPSVILLFGIGLIGLAGASRARRNPLG